MKFYPRSLRQKLLLSYATGVVLVLAFIFLSWNNLSAVQEIDASGDVVSSLFDTTLELRRYEKNFFLYRTDDDRDELFIYIDRAEELLQREELYRFTTPEVVNSLRDDVRDYRVLLREETGSEVLAGNPQLESSIREKGKEIVETTEKISADRNVIKRDELDAAKRNLLVGIALLVASGFAGGLFFYNKALKPLSVLEEHMQRITDGEFSLIRTQFRDRELVSLKTAFNKMLIELHERQRYLVQSEKLASFGTLVFGVAHELNNPLSNIYTSSQILREEIEDDDIEFKKELLSQIEAETARARDVVGSLLEFSRPRDKEMFLLRQAVDETIRLIKAEIPANVSIEVRIGDGLSIFGDKQKIQQVILNLIQNALDAIEGEGFIRISANKIADHGEKVGIVVIDNGAGMEEEQLSSIFDPFFTSKKKGYGLGLFIVHNIIEEHGGTIRVDSHPGRGTTFSILLPAKGREQ